MNIFQTIGVFIMAYGCAVPICFLPKLEYINIVGMFIFVFGGAIFIFGSENGFTIERLEGK